jgi:hypothetical protein
MAAMVAIPKPPSLLLRPGTLVLGLLEATVAFLKFSSLLLCIFALVLGVIAAAVLLALAVGVMA